jgi:site-specific DNA-methyltransferase (adenine-specific)
MRREVIGDCELWLGDCREVLPMLGKVDAVVTDPPYGIAHKWQGGGGRGWGRADAQKADRNAWDEAAPSAELLAQIIGISQEAIIWGGNYFELPPSRCWLVWNKPERGFTLAEAELAWTNRDNVVRVFDCARSEPDRVHPTQKPVALMAWCVEKTRGVVLDPFCGAGTTGVACANLGRRFIGIEREAEWFDHACRRIEQAYRQPRLFAEPAPRAEQLALLAEPGAGG